MAHNLLEATVKSSLLSSPFLIPVSAFISHTHTSILNFSLTHMLSLHMITRDLSMLFEQHYAIW